MGRTGAELIAFEADEVVACDESPGDRFVAGDGEAAQLGVLTVADEASEALHVPAGPIACPSSLRAERVPSAPLPGHRDPSVR